MALYTISLCSGVGGLDLGVELALGGTRPICYVEREITAAEILASRFADGSLEEAPIWSDLATFDGSRFRGMADIWLTAGFPCPDYSVAGKRAGRFGKHGQVWDHVARAIGDIRPRCCLLENVPGILIPHGDEGNEWVLPAGLWFVLGDLSVLGYDAEWLTLRASDVGAPHQRNRIFILAYRGMADPGDGFLPEPRRGTERRDGAGSADPILDGAGLVDANSARLEGRPGEQENDGEQCATTERSSGIPLFPPGPSDAVAWRDILARFPWLAPAIGEEEAESLVRRLADGMASGLDGRADRLRAGGNGVVALQAAVALMVLAQRAGIKWGGGR